MKKIKILLLILVSTLMLTSFQQQAPTHVYICKGLKSAYYHAKKNCNGLRSCSDEIIRVTRSEAIDNYKRRPCKICCSTCSDTLSSSSVMPQQKCDYQIVAVLEMFSKTTQ